MRRVYASLQRLVDFYAGWGDEAGGRFYVPIRLAHEAVKMAEVGVWTEAIVVATKAARRARGGANWRFFVADLVAAAQADRFADWGLVHAKLGTADQYFCEIVRWNKEICRSVEGDE